MKYIGKYKGNVGTTHGTLVSGLVGYYNRIINLSKYLIGGYFTTYSPNINLLESYKNSISITRTHDAVNFESSPFNGLTTNIVATIDNSTQIDPEFTVTKINRLNSNVSHPCYLEFQHYQIAPGETMEFSFWYYGTFGTIVTVYSQEEGIYVERWDATTNDYITNNSRLCNVPVTTNTWQYIKVRAINTHTTLNKIGVQWLRLHENQRNASLSNTEYWKITCVKSWYVESITKNKIIRLNDDGSIDDSWYNNSSYTSGGFYQLTYDNINKKIYATSEPALEGGLVRFNLDGTKDTSFNIGTGFNGRVRNVKIDNINSKIYVGGYFSMYNGSTQNRLVRLHMDGSLDTSFNIGTGFNGNIYTIDLDTINQKIYVAGYFTTFQGSTQNRLIRLNMDGSKDNTFNIGTGFNGNVYALYLDTINQKIYVGGGFSTFNGTTQNRLIRLNMDGSKDTSFNIGTGFNFNVYAINIDTINQKIYVGGDFDTFNGLIQNALVRLNMNGSKDTSFNIGTGFNNSNNINNIIIDNINSKIYVGGWFTIYNNQQQKYIARLNMDGSKDNTFNIQLNSGVETILKYTV